MGSGARSAPWQESMHPVGPGVDDASAAPMALSSVGMGSGGTPTGADLRHSGGPWMKAAGVAESLLAGMGTAKSRLTTAHDGTTAGLHGLTCAAALKALLASWEERVGAVKAECDSLAPALRRVAKEQHERDARVKSSIDGLQVSSKNAPVDAAGR